jgi:hypothetical protein
MEEFGIEALKFLRIEHGEIAQLGKASAAYESISYLCRSAGDEQIERSRNSYIERLFETIQMNEWYVESMTHQYFVRELCNDPILNLHNM